MEARQSPRYRVQYRSLFSAGERLLVGEGLSRDLSIRGCRIASDTVVPSRTDLELRLYLPDQEWPVQISLATVRWTAGTEFGVEFLQLSGDDAARIGRVLSPP